MFNIGDRSQGLEFLYRELLNKTKMISSAAFDTS